MMKFDDNVEQTSRSARERILNAEHQRTSQRLNVLFLPGWYPSEENPVAGTFIREHARAAARYHNVTVLYVTRTQTGPRGKWQIQSDKVEEGIRTVRVSWREFPVPKTALLLHLWIMAAAYRYIRRSGFSPDIIHAHIYFMAFAAVLLGKFFRKPVVITEQSSQFLRGCVPESKLVDLRRHFQHMAMILPVSAWLQESMQSFGIVGKFQVVPNTYDASIFFPSTDALKSSKGQSIPRLLTVGLLSEPKGIPVLLRALHEVQQTDTHFQLDIVGDGPMRSDYERLSIELGLQEKVTFHGMKDKAIVAKMMQRCTFYVQASLWETFGVTVVEAMACGRPVVATEIPTMEEKVDVSSGVLVPAGDEMALASAIREMLGSYQSYDGKQIATQAFNLYSHAAVGKALNVIYTKVRLQNGTS
ncbi:MAG: glycosyltransferase [Anaerolineales bacterium]|jgi:glycosyltransferase involved in cell wall biosynthesis